MRLARPITCVAIGAVGASALIARASRVETLFVGVALVLASVCLLAVARRQLGRAFTWGLPPQARFLVTEGLYSRIPHPMLAFILLGLLGLVVVSRKQWLVLFWLACTIEAALHARRESRVLEAAFGDDYRKYRSRTWW